jgi:hypothetical protein
MTTFANTINPTPFGIFDSEIDFQNEADNMVNFVKMKLGDSILSVELTRKQIWSCFEEASLEYSAQVNQMQIKSELTNILGLTASIDLTNKYPRRTFEFLLRQAEPYANAIGVAGSSETPLGYFNLADQKQEYDIYTELYGATGSLSGVLISSVYPTKLRIMEVFHIEPLAAQHFLHVRIRISRTQIKLQL